MCFHFRSDLPSSFNGIEVAVIGPPGDPELGQAEVISPLDHWLPQIDGSIGSVVLILLCICYSMLLDGKINFNEKIERTINKPRVILILVLTPISKEDVIARLPRL